MGRGVWDLSARKRVSGAIDIRCWRVMVPSFRGVKSLLLGGVLDAIFVGLCCFLYILCRSSSMILCVCTPFLAPVKWSGGC